MNMIIKTSTVGIRLSVSIFTPPPPNIQRLITMPQPHSSKQAATQKAQELGALPGQAKTADLCDTGGRIPLRM